MKKHGFRLMAWITMNSNEHPYHVDLHEYVQHDRLFFSLPGKTMMVMLELHQCFGKTERWTHSYWSGWVLTNWNTVKEYQDYLDSIRGTDEMWDHDPDEVGYTTRQAIKDSGVFDVGWGSGSRYSEKWTFDQIDAYHSSLPTAEQITSPFPNIIEAIGKYMYEQFNDLQVTEFPPHYCFEQCERWFWTQFPIERLLTKVRGRIWGSEGVPVPQNRQ
jgi:hypothetical protein